MNKFIATLVFVLLLPLYFLSLMNFAFKATILNGDYLKKELNNQSVYSKLMTSLDEVVAQAVPQEGEGLPASEVAKAIKENIAPADLQTVIELAIDGKSGTEIQKEISSKLEASLRAKYDALPVCSEAVETACRPEGVAFEQMGETDFLGMPLDINKTLTESQEQTMVRSTRTSIFTGYVPYFFAALLVLILILLARLFAGSWKKTIFPTGLFLVILGVTSLFSGWLIFSQIIPAVIKNLPAAELPYMYENLLLPLSTQIMRDTGKWLNSSSIYLAELGAILVVVSIVLYFATKPKDTKTT